MEDINIKSEFSDEMEETYSNYDLNTNSAGNYVRTESRNIKYDLTDEYEEMEDGNELTTYHSTADGSQQQLEGSGSICENAPPQDADRLNNLPAPTRNIVDGANVRFEFTAGYRRNSVLIYLVDEKQLFTKKYAHNHLDRYTCYTKSCKASLLFDTYLNRIVKLYHTFHLHPDQSDVYKKMKVLNEMKDYCLTNDGSNLTTKQIFDRKCDVMKEAAHLVEYNKIKRNLNRLKKTAMQKPITIYHYGNMIPGNNDPAEKTNEFAEKWDTNLSNRVQRVPSPNSSEADSIAAASVSSAIEQSATTSTLAVQSSANQSKVQKPAFKKIKLTHHEVPYTEGYLEDIPNPTFEFKTSNIRKTPPRPNPRLYHQEENNHVCSSCPCIAAQESEYDKIGKAWASELKLMTTDQQIFAKRAIAEIIFEGQMGGLSRNSVLVRQEIPANESDPFVENSEYLFDKSESPHAVAV